MWPEKARFTLLPARGWFLLGHPGLEAAKDSNAGGGCFSTARAKGQWSSKALVFHKTKRNND